MPRLERVSRAGIPEPFRSLLVHSLDLTPTLETFYRQTLGLNVISRWMDGGQYLREVVLRLVDTEKPVGYGAIRIQLGHLPPRCATRVKEEQVPFGSILRADDIPHLGWPQAFFRVHSDVHMQRLLGIPEACRLYGRRNLLLDGSRRLLAEVIEILAPVDGFGRHPASPKPCRHHGNGSC
jgi:hypothetical protein